MTSLALVLADDVAFRDWYDRTLPHVYRYLLTRCGGETQLAEDLTQQTFVEAVRNPDRFDGRSNIVTWLCAIGRHKLVDHYRRSGREARRGAELVLVSHHDPWSDTETRDSVERVLARLPGDQRLALVFRYLDDLSVRHVAAALGRSESAAESLLSRARESFRRAYEAQTDA